MYLTRGSACVGAPPIAEFTDDTLDISILIPPVLRPCSDTRQWDYEDDVYRLTWCSVLPGWYRLRLPIAQIGASA